MNSPACSDSLPLILSNSKRLSKLLLTSGELISVMADPFVPVRFLSSAVWNMFTTRDAHRKPTTIVFTFKDFFGFR